MYQTIRCSLPSLYEFEIITWVISVFAAYKNSGPSSIVFPSRTGVACTCWIFDTGSRVTLSKMMNIQLVLTSVEKNDADPRPPGSEEVRQTMTASSCPFCCGMGTLTGCPFGWTHDEEVNPGALPSLAETYCYQGIKVTNVSCIHGVQCN